MKVLLDANISRLFEAALKERLEPEGHQVVHSHDVGLDDLDNGELMKAAMDSGFTHIASLDKNMAKKHVPLMPILVFDQPSRADSRHALATVDALADRLLNDPPGTANYHGIAVPGYEPGPTLAIILAGRHTMAPDFETKHRRRVEAERAKAGTRDRGR